ncbi:MAG: DUF1624 domain-containing protein [Syntrophobacterales bacterium]|nr:MAG: DUF1624 domain-containing protein [Syntrophobacterales bacterium]
MNRVLSIDVLRGFALIGMVLCHFMIYFGDSTAASTWPHFILNHLLGDLGAACFLMMMGMSQALSADIADRRAATAVQEGAHPRRIHIPDRHTHAGPDVGTRGDMAVGHPDPHGDDDGDSFFLSITAPRVGSGRVSFHRRSHSLVACGHRLRSGMGRTVRSGSHPIAIFSGDPDRCGVGIQGDLETSGCSSRLPFHRIFPPHALVSLPAGRGCHRPAHRERSNSERPALPHDHRGPVCLPGPRGRLCEPLPSRILHHQRFHLAPQHLSGFVHHDQSPDGHGPDRVQQFAFLL